MSRHVLTEFEGREIAKLLPPKPHGVAPVNDRRKLNGIFWGLGSGLPGRDLQERDGPSNTFYNRWRRWTSVGPWCRIMVAIMQA
jgi:transposase